MKKNEHGRQTRQYDTLVFILICNKSTYNIHQLKFEPESTITYKLKSDALTTELHLYIYINTSLEPLVFQSNNFYDT